MQRFQKQEKCNYKQNAAEKVTHTSCLLKRSPQLLSFDKHLLWITSYFLFVCKFCCCCCSLVHTAKFIALSATYWLHAKDFLNVINAAAAAAVVLVYYIVLLLVLLLYFRFASLLLFALFFIKQNWRLYFRVPLQKQQLHVVIIKCAQQLLGASNVKWRTPQLRTHQGVSSLRALKRLET